MGRYLFIENRITISRPTRHFEPINGCQFRQHTSGVLAAHFRSFCLMSEIECRMFLNFIFLIWAINGGMIMCSN